MSYPRHNSAPPSPNALSPLESFKSPDRKPDQTPTPTSSSLPAFPSLSSPGALDLAQSASASSEFSLSDPPSPSTLSEVEQVFPTGLSFRDGEDDADADSAVTTSANNASYAYSYNYWAANPHGWPASGDYSTGMEVPPGATWDPNQSASSVGVEAVPKSSSSDAGPDTNAWNSGFGDSGPLRRTPTEGWINQQNRTRRSIPNGGYGGASRDRRSVPHAHAGYVNPPYPTSSSGPAPPPHFAPVAFYAPLADPTAHGSSAQNQPSQSGTAPKTPGRESSQTSSPTSPNPNATLRRQQTRSLPDPDPYMLEDALSAYNMGSTEWLSMHGYDPSSLSDPLFPAPPSQAPKELEPKDEEELVEEINKVFEFLLPTRDSIERRLAFRDKLQRIIDTEWPGRGGTVELFGSSTNGLGTHMSDVDVCLLMDLPPGKASGVGFMNEMSEVLRRHGMTKIKVIPAKVAICKFIDPEYNLACDINLNTRISLRNTELVRSYVAVDPRVRKLCIMVKYWAKRRQLNDAATGGTLSSYCWVMMAINYLQQLDPPILPCLQTYRAPSDSDGTNPDPSFVDGVDTTFFSDVSYLQGFGDENPSSAASLLYGFFRRYALEFDYSRDVASVRTGSVLTKRQKRWDKDFDRLCNILCVEEPFNPQRNLANSADRWSVAGIRGEFRRALEILASTGSLEECCRMWTEVGGPAQGGPVDAPSPVLGKASGTSQTESDVPNEERPHPHQPNPGQPLSHASHLRSVSAPPSPPPYPRMTHFTPTYSPSGLLYNRPNARFGPLMAAFTAQAARGFVHGGIPVTGPVILVAGYQGGGVLDEAAWYGGYPSMMAPGVISGAMYPTAESSQWHAGHTNGYYPVGYRDHEPREAPWKRRDTLQSETSRPAPNTGDSKDRSPSMVLGDSSTIPTSTSRHSKSGNGGTVNGVGSRTTGRHFSSDQEVDRESTPRISEHGKGWSSVEVQKQTSAWSPERQNTPVAAVVEAWSRGRTQDVGKSEESPLVSKPIQASPASTLVHGHPPTQATLVESSSEVFLESPAPRAAGAGDDLSILGNGSLGDRKKGSKPSVLWTNVSHRRNGTGNGNGPRSTTAAEPALSVDDTTTPKGGKTGKRHTHSHSHTAKDEKQESVVRGRQLQLAKREKLAEGKSRSHSGRRSSSAPAHGKKPSEGSRVDNPVDGDPAAKEPSTAAGLLHSTSSQQLSNMGDSLSSASAANGPLSPTSRGAPRWASVVANGSATKKAPAPSPTSTATPAVGGSKVRRDVAWTAVVTGGASNTSTTNKDA